MKLRRLNATLTGILMLCLLGHCAVIAVMFLTNSYYPVLCAVFGRATATIFIVHALLSAYIIFFVHDKKTTKISYPALNKRMIIQRVSALIMIVFLPLHLIDYNFLESGTPLSIFRIILLILCETIFFLSIFVHISLSVSRACITFGDFRTEKAERLVDIIVTVVCAALFILMCFAIFRFVLTWPRP